MTERYYSPGGEPPTDRDREILAEHRRKKMLGVADKVAKRNSELLRRLADND